MRTQARPFSVEFKQRKRTTQSQLATAVARPGAWPHLLPLANAPKRSAHQALAAAPRQKETVREAERLFQPPWDGVQTVARRDTPFGSSTLTESPVQPLRVLPDLIAAAREQQQRAAVQAPARKRAPKGSLTSKRQSKIGREEPTTADLLTRWKHLQSPLRL
jgi:hypothetical protein